MIDVEPVFIVGVDAPDLATALQSAITAIPTAMPTFSSDYQSPVLRAMNVKSATAFERGLKSATLQFGESGYFFFRYVPHPMFKRGLRREDDPVFVLPANATLSAVAEKISTALSDPAWPVRQPKIVQSRGKKRRK